MGKQTDGREDDLERREADVANREAALAERTKAAEAILHAADERDVSADTRDAAADQRENDLDRAELLAAPDKHGYGGDWPERRNASLDRGRAKADRTASHDDRIALTEGPAEDDPDPT